MSKVAGMHQQTIAGLKDALKEEMKALSGQFDLLFNRAPVMMHVVNQEFRIEKVNQRWLETLGYERDEVLGHKPTDFMTEESRLRAIIEVLPHFWRSGADRCVAMQFVRKDGEVLDLLIDAEVNSVSAGNNVAYAAIYTSYDSEQWKQAAAMIKALQQITREQAKFEGILSSLETDRFESPLSPSAAIGPDVRRNALMALPELSQDISTNLRALLDV